MCVGLQGSLAQGCAWFPNRLDRCQPQTPTSLDDDWGEVVLIQLSDEKSTKLSEVLDELLSSSVIPVSKLQYAAGVLGWLSSIVPAARPWMSMIWGALQQALT